MALIHDFEDTVRDRARKDPDFRVGLFTEAMECLFRGEADIAKHFLRQYIDATIGFKELAKITNRKPENLMRMLSSSGNPSLSNLSLLLASLHKREGIELHVSAD